MNFIHLFLYFFMFLFLLYFFLNFLTNNILLWWRVFIIITLTFVLLNKIQGDFGNSLNYFLLQEFLGFLFLVFFSTLLQYILLIIKIGISPFHFWITSVFLNLENFILIWFLTFQKLPFLPVLILMFKFLFIYLIILGVVFCYFQLMNIKNYKVMIALSSTESFNWLVVGVLIGVWGFFVMTFYYIVRMVILINYQLFLNYINFYMELFLVFLNVPLSFSFFLKIFILGVSVNYLGYYLLFIIMIIVLSSLSFISWFVNYRAVVNKKYQDQINYFIIFLYFMFIVIFFFRFSKSLLYYLDRIKLKAKEQ